MNPATQSRSRAGTLLAGVLGGLVVLVVGAVLIATDVIDTGDDRTVVRSAPPLSNAADGEDTEGRTVQDIYRDAGRGVVFIEAQNVSADSPFGFPQEEGGPATGSGFVVDRDGHIVTNDHVVSGADQVSVSFEEGGEAVDADVVGEDPSSDLALLKVDPDDAELQPIPLGSSDGVSVGDPVVAIGNPFGLSRTVTTGIVSAKQRQIRAPNGFSIDDVIQTDASINPGNSGGPLLDARGEVIGVNSQIATGGGQGSVGIGFAVPVKTVKDVVRQLKEDGTVERPYLGVNMAPVTEDVARQLDLPVDSGVIVVGVPQGGPADEAGLRAGIGASDPGDVIVEIDGREVTSPDDLTAILADKEPGDEVEVVFYRGDDRRTARIELGSRPATAEAQQQLP
jgi:S1-C subfamily serine protease